MEISDKALYCEKCSLQFDKKIVYDIHLSFVHKICGKLESEEKTIEIKEVDSCSVFHSDSKNSDSIEALNKMTKIKEEDRNAVFQTHSKKQVHEGKKPHKCSICDYSCSTTKNLKKHVEAVHDGKKPHKCSICNYSSSTKGDLKKHVEAVHDGKNRINAQFVITAFHKRKI